MQNCAGRAGGCNFIVVVSLCLLALNAAGCTSVITDFTVISTQSENATLHLGARVQGESCNQVLFGVIPVTGDPQASLRQAIERALDSGKAKFLVDGIASEQTTGLPPIFHRHCYLVEGTAANPPLP
jgi:hypothetical protein